MEYKTIAIIHRKGKEISFLLKDGEVLSYENIVDVLIHNQPERPNPEACEHKLVYREPNPETMSPAIKAKYELAKKLTGCDGLNTMET